MTQWIRRIGVVLAAAFTFTAPLQAATTTAYQLLVQSRDDANAPTEVYLASFASLDDVFAADLGVPTGFTDIEVSPDYTIAGLTWDGSAYRLLVQSRADGTAPSEVYLASFATLADLLSADLGASTGFTDIEVSPDYTIAGLTWDGSAYRMLVESRADGTAPAEVYLASFATLADLFSASLGNPTGFTDIEVSPDYRIADLTWDGSAYRVLVESLIDSTASSEVYLASFATLDDLFAADIGGATGFTAIEVSPDFQIVGFSSVTTIDPLPPSVPEPATWSLLIVGFGATGFVMRRRRVVVAPDA